MKKRLMAFLLAVVTTVGSLPMAPVFAEEDEFVEVVVEDEEVVEDAGSVSAAKLTKMELVSKNGATNTAIGAEIQISANEVLNVSANLTTLSEAGTLDEGVEYRAVASIKTESGNFAELKKAEVEVKANDAKNALYTADYIQIEGKDNGFGDVTVKIVSKNGANWVDVSNAAKATFKLTVVKVAEDATTEEETTEPETPATEPEEVIDYEALAEAQKDAEGV
ncbi:MAG: hypothetical protein K6B44_05375, partial [Lachnospiraceae bacterium]|nr:hypothetical protein [Lachnospiraceae bacterium]